MEVVQGFSKLTKGEKLQRVARQLPEEIQKDFLDINKYWCSDIEEQNLFDKFSENTLTNFFLPYGVVPNFSINNKIKIIPMVIEESSVVAAAARSANFWLKRGGFHYEVLGTRKVGQIHLLWKNKKIDIYDYFQKVKNDLFASVEPIQENMKRRGGGLQSIELVDKTKDIENYYQLKAEFETCDAMGANFINSILEAIAKKFKMSMNDNECEIIMSILSNYTPDCKVRAWVECPLSDLGEDHNSGEAFAQKFVTAVNIAQVDKERAVTHNKGILNGVDAVVLASGNDFRAVEACAHAYASESGNYKSLTKAMINNDCFRFEIEIPLALGVVGGLTSLHPMSRLTLKILENPSASELMGVAACVGLAQNFGAIRSLVTTGIQQGHMKMHLFNILNQLNAKPWEQQEAIEYFKDKTVSFTSVRSFLELIRVRQ